VIDTLFVKMDAQTVNAVKSIASKIDVVAAFILLSAIFRACFNK